MALPKKGAKVRWDTSQGETHGTVEKIVTTPTKVKGYTAKATKEAPQVMVKSAKSGKVAVHKPEELKPGNAKAEKPKRPKPAPPKPAPAQPAAAKSKTAKTKAAKPKAAKPTAANPKAGKPKAPAPRKAG